MALTVNHSKTTSVTVLMIYVSISNVQVMSGQWFTILCPSYGYRFNIVGSVIAWHNVPGSPLPEPRRDVVHSCRNFDKIVEWAKANKVPAKESNVPS